MTAPKHAGPRGLGYLPKGGRAAAVKKNAEWAERVLAATAAVAAEAPTRVVERTTPGPAVVQAPAGTRQRVRLAVWAAGVCAASAGLGVGVMSLVSR